MSALDQAFIKAYMQHEVAEAEPSWQSRDDAYGATLHDEQSSADDAVDAAAPEEPLSDHGRQGPAVREEAPDARAAQGFRSMLRVDRVTWPTSVTKMASAARESLDRVVDQLAVAASQGCRVVAFQGCRRGDGCTTLLLAAGRRLAERGVSVVLVDADVDHPRLARRLGLAPEAGWEAVLTGRLPLAEVVVQSQEDRVSLLPFCEPAAEAERLLAGQADLGPVVEVLRETYEVILLDLGRANKRSRINPLPPESLSSWLNAVLLVRNVRATPESEVVENCQQLEAAGIEDVAVVENFV